MPGVTIFADTLEWGREESAPGRRTTSRWKGGKEEIGRGRGRGEGIWM